MKRSLVALALLALPLLSGTLTACSSEAAQSGDSNTDSQVTQPPTPSGNPVPGATSSPTG